MQDNLVVTEPVDTTGVVDSLPDLPEMNVVKPRQTALRRAWERGQATAEYVVGILAAVALALVLLKVVTGNDFFSSILKFVTNLISKAGGMLP